QGYAITIKRSQSGPNGKIKNMIFGRYYRNRLNLTENSCCRQIASRLTGCQFELSGAKHNNVRFPEVENPEHNNKASADMSGH
ncbi:15483_t:CDS:1, partial [Gigaspora rosea]